MDEQLSTLMDSLPGPLRDAVTYLEQFPLVRAAALVALFLVVAWVVKNVLVHWLERLVSRTETDVDDQIIALVKRPAFVTVALFGVSLAVQTLELPEGPTLLATRSLRTIVMLVWIGFGLRFFSLLLAALARQPDRFQLVEERSRPLFDNVIRVGLVGAAVYIGLRIWSIDATAWLASAGIVGIAMGFAAKDTLANLFSGLFILADRPYAIGDFIILDSGERGRVTAVGIRTSRLLTRDDIEIIIPNAVIANSKIINESGGPYAKERIRIPVGVAYGTDVDHVCDVLVGIAQRHEHVCEDPEPKVRFRRFGDSSLDFELLAWIDEPILRGRMVHELNLEVYRTFQREGIAIPFPQRDVWMRSASAGESAEG